MMKTLPISNVLGLTVICPSAPTGIPHGYSGIGYIGTIIEEKANNFVTVEFKDSCGLALTRVFHRDTLSLYTDGSN